MDDTEEYPPRELWGLDYYLRVYNKMYIRDVCNLKLYPYHQEAFAYKNHPIYKVDILGVIVRVEERSKCFIYALDDGTGVVSCCCWKPDSFATADHPKYSGLPSSLRDRLKDLDAADRNTMSGYSHGDLVHVKGKVKVFREVNEVTAIYHANVDNPAAEVTRMMELPKLYTACYDKPFELPHHVRLERDIIRKESMTGQKSSNRIVQELVAALREHLKLVPSVPEFTANQMCRVPALVPILSQQQSEEVPQSAVAMVTQALAKLEEDYGHVCRRMEAKSLYENLIPRCPLDDTIMKILIRETQKPKFSEKGCHCFHLLTELHKTVQYSKLHKTALLHCLQKLETNSEVIRTYHKQYLPCVT